MPSMGMGRGVYAGVLSIEAREGKIKTVNWAVTIDGSQRCRQPRIYCRPTPRAAIVGVCTYTPTAVETKGKTEERWRVMRPELLLDRPGWMATAGRLRYPTDLQTRR